MLVAIGLASPGLFFLQAVNHSFAKVALFLVSGNIIQTTGGKTLSDLRGVLRFSPAWGILLALAACAVTGVPPFGAFISEWLILTTSAASNQWLVILLLLAGISLSFIAVSIHVSRILLGNPIHVPECKVSLASSLIPSVLIGVLIVLGITTGSGLMSSILQKGGVL